MRMRRKKAKAQPQARPLFNISSQASTSIMKWAHRDVEFKEQEEYPPITEKDEWLPVISERGEPLLYNKTHKYYMTTWGWKLPREMFER